MIQLFQRIQACPIEFSEQNKGNSRSYIQTQDITQHIDSSQFESIITNCLRSQSEATLFLNKTDFTSLVQSWFKLVFKNTENDSFRSFVRHYVEDIRIKANRFDYSDSVFYEMRSYKLPLENKLQDHQLNIAITPHELSFEILLYNALSSDRIEFWNPLLAQVEELSWKKLIYDWLILKNQIINAFSNDLTKLCKFEKQIPNDPKERLDFIRNDLRFKWIMDNGFHPNNWRKIKKTYDPMIYADLYSSWIRYRSTQPLDETNLKYTTLKDVIKNMIEGNWKKLLLKDIRSNWVSTYVESSDYKYFNLSIIGRIYDSYNNNSLHKMNFLEVSEQVII